MNKIPFSSHLLVGSQVMGIALAVWPNSNYWLPAVLPLLLGLAIGLWVIYYNRIGNFSIYPEPVEHGELIIGGPYRWLRHPMYSALLLITWGAALFNGEVMNLIGAVIVLSVVLFKMPREEKYLLARFENYQKYCSQTKRLIPGIW